jgi:hypothetical protein
VNHVRTAVRRLVDLFQNPTAIVLDIGFDGKLARGDAERFQDGLSAGFLPSADAMSRNRLFVNDRSLCRKPRPLDSPRSQRPRLV